MKVLGCAGGHLGILGSVEAGAWMFPLGGVTKPQEGRRAQGLRWGLKPQLNAEKIPTI